MALVTAYVTRSALTLEYEVRVRVKDPGAEDIFWQQTVSEADLVSAVHGAYLWRAITDSAARALAPQTRATEDEIREALARAINNAPEPGEAGPNLRVAVTTDVGAFDRMMREAFPEDRLRELARRPRRGPFSPPAGVRHSGSPPLAGVLSRDQTDELMRELEQPVYRREYLGQWREPVRLETEDGEVHNFVRGQGWEFCITDSGELPDPTPLIHLARIGEAIAKALEDPTVLRGALLEFDTAPPAPDTDYYGTGERQLELE